MAVEITPIELSRTVGLAVTMKGLDTADMADVDSDSAGYIDIDTVDWDPSKMILVVGVSTATTNAGIKFVSSTNSPYTGSGITDLTIDLNDTANALFSSEAGSTGHARLSIILAPETARFKDTDGRINFEKSTQDTDTDVYRVAAIVLP